MAGIGFGIRRLLEKDTYISSLKAHFYSMVIVSGPWILSIITLFTLSYFKPANIDIFELAYFRTVIIYIYAFSLIIVGLLYLSLSRYLSDKLFSKETDAIVPAFNSSAVFVLLVQSVFGWSVFAWGGLEFPVKLFAVLTYLTISMIWLIMIFLTALRDYKTIAIIYGVGCVIAVTTSLIMGSALGLAGYFAGYFIGHLFIVAMLSCRIFIEFRSGEVFDRDLFSFLLRNKYLVFAGFFYNLAIWSDKIAFWISRRSMEITFFLRTFPEYEAASFLAYLTIIPALSLFITKMETDFYMKYKTFYAQVLDRGTYSEIKQAKDKMTERLRYNIGLIITSQGIISLLCVTFAAQIAAFLRLTSIQIPIFRVCIVGAFLHSLLLIVIILILYFDFKDLALYVSVLFFVTNAAFTYITSFMPDPYIGYGYVLSALISLIAAFYLFDYKLSRLEYLTFALQPLGVHREEEVA